MGRRKTGTTKRPSSARSRWLQAQMQGVKKDHAGALGDRSWSAVAALRRQLQALRLEYDQEAERLSEEAAGDAGQMTQEQRLAALGAAAVDAPEQELEVFLAEWLRRKGHRLTVSGDTLRLVREE